MCIPGERSTHKRVSRPGTVWCRRLLPLIGTLLLTLTAVPSFAGSSAGCDGGGFSLLGLSGDQRRIVLAPNVGSSVLVQGKYVEFTVDAATFGVRDWTLTSAANSLDITGGRRTVIYTFNWQLPASSGVPDVRVRVIARDKIFQDSSDGAATVFSITP
jgi:hypothetical protein